MAVSLRHLVFGSLVLIGGAGLRAQAVQMDPQFVTAARAPQPAESIAATLKIVDADALRRIPAATLDGALRSIPAFSLFRRSDSLTAHPTAQGVSLRGLGPSGASRSLVLLDGVPLNDPFGGWVAWTKVPRESLTRVELVPGGGSTAWGNAALGGVLQLLGETSPVSTGSYAALLGDFETRSLEIAAAHGTERNTVHVRGRAFATNGFSLMAPERRGPIDIPAWSRHRWASGGWRHSFDSGLHVSANARVYEEKRGNGTPYQQNGSREKFVSVHAGGGADRDFSWTAAAYAQDQTFRSTFSAVNATRTAETPASDQFAVPATAFGAAWTGRWRHSAGTPSHTSAGVDTRFVRGETRENFTYSAGNFTRQRIAGGRQDVTGVFAFHERRVVADVRATLGARIDAWRDSDGHRREFDRVTGATLREDHYANRDGTAFSPSAGVIWQPAGSPTTRVRAHVQRAYRRPTLNELYRPFRVGPNVTEANPALGTERVTSAELGLEWSGPPAAAGSAASSAGWSPLTFGAVLFRNDLHDAVGNVTIARGPGTFPIVGFVAAGGVGRQRLSLERTRVQGAELSARWRPTSGVMLSTEYLYNDAKVTRTALAPGLVGKRIAQVPRHAAAASGVFTGWWDLVLAPRLRWMGRQFEDDENQLVLGEVVVGDIGISRALSPRAELFLNVENVGDARIETGRTADGLVNVGTPRLVTFGVRGSW